MISGVLFMLIAWLIPMPLLVSILLTIWGSGLVLYFFIQLLAIIFDLL